MKILIVQTAFLGDVVLSTPVIAAVKSEYPEAELWFLSTPEGCRLVKRDPYLNGVISFDKNRSERSLVALLAKARELETFGFDLAFALQRSARTALLLWLARIPCRIGFNTARLKWLYHETRQRNPTQHDVLRNLQIVSERFHSEKFHPEGDGLSDLRLFRPTIQGLSPNFVELLPNSPYIVLVPGSAWATKRWDWRGYRALAKLLLQEGYCVVIAGAASERPLSEAVCDNLELLNLCGSTSLDELLYLVSDAAGIVCNDSMSLHIASAFKVPTVTIFCATSPNFGFGPWKNRAIVLEAKDLKCKPCSRHGAQRCPVGTWECTTAVSPVVVYQQLRTLISSKSQSAALLN